MAIGLDKDCSTGRVFWSDISEKKIFNSKYDGTDKKVFISEGSYNNIISIYEKLITFQWTNLIYRTPLLFVIDIISPEGIAIDWVSRRIYWTDSQKHTIEVADLEDAKIRATIASTGLQNPRGIAVDPFQKWVLT